MTLQSQAPQDKVVILDGQELDAETVALQWAAHGARVRGASILLFCLVAGLILIFAVSYGLAQTLSGQAALSFFLLFGALLFAAVYFGNNWWQWRVLYFFGLRCPHCGQPLFDRIHWSRRPAYECPACGKRALATTARNGRRITARAESQREPLDYGRILSDAPCPERRQHCPTPMTAAP